MPLCPHHKYKTNKITMSYVTDSNVVNFGFQFCEFQLYNHMQYLGTESVDFILIVILIWFCMLVSYIHNSMALWSLNIDSCLSISLWSCLKLFITSLLSRQVFHMMSCWITLFTSHKIGSIMQPICHIFALSCTKASTRCAITPIMFSMVWAKDWADQPGCQQCRSTDAVVVYPVAS